jgi:hypothetical protein
MTHTLHREGDEQNLKGDYTLLCIPAKGINDIGSGAKKQCFLQIALANNAVNAGFAIFGSLMQHSKQKLIKNIKDGNSIQVCCANQKDVLRILRGVLDEGIDLSIVVQGIFEDVKDCLKQVGFNPHTVHHSLGVWGRTEKLPSKNILELTTMCGHGLVSSNLANQCLMDVAAGIKNPREAAELLGSQCSCGVFNIRRAELLLEKEAKIGKKPIQNRNTRPN